MLGYQYKGCYRRKCRSCVLWNAARPFSTSPVARLNPSPDNTLQMRSLGDVGWNSFSLLQHIKKPHYPQLELLRVHVGGGFRNICSIQTEGPPIPGSVFTVIGQGKGEEGSQGTRRARGGWCRIYDLSFFFLICWKTRLLARCLQKRVQLVLISGYEM